MYQRAKERSAQAIPKPYRFVRLAMNVNPSPLLKEVEAVAISWLPSRWKWHMGTFFCILRGGPEGRHPGSALTSGADVDAPVLDRLPLMRAFLNETFSAPARMAWLGLSPSGTCIHLHVDNTNHWDEHHRFHVPLVTGGRARLCVAGRFQHLPAGTVWAINNSQPHGALNLGPRRLHLMMDLPPTSEVEALIAAGTHLDGALDPEALARLSRDPFESLTEDERADSYLMEHLRLQ